jgi:dTDP-4-dehydrorhamnose 3,5-epimerase
MWDNRKDSETFGRVMTVVVGEDAPASVLIPGGVVHAYQNIGEVVGLVINCPNQLYMGEGKRERVDEIRYEGDPNTVFQMSD